MSSLSRQSYSGRLTFSLVVYVIKVVIVIKLDIKVTLFGSHYFVSVTLLEGALLCFSV